MGKHHTYFGAVVVCALLMMLTASACGGSDSPSPAPSPTPSPSPSPTPTPSPSPGATATVTISGNAVSPRAVTITQGGRVTFVNNDTRTHDMASNPHPEHTQCPEINSVGFLSPGQSRATSNMNTVRTCGFHDHNQDSNTALQGTITITQ